MAVITGDGNGKGKRPKEWLSVNRTHTYSSPNSSHYSRKSKRPRFSSMPRDLTRPASYSNSTVSRISRYPQATPPLHREVHAPCRPRKFDFLTVSRRESSLIGNDMGNVLHRNYQQAKKSALASFRFLRKGIEAAKSDTGIHKDSVSEDSSVEEVIVIEDGPESHVAVTETPKFGAKVVDGGLQQHSTSSVVSELKNSYTNKEVVNAAKMLDSLSLNQEQHDLPSATVYKKLLEDVDRRTDTLKRLRLEIQLNEKRRTTFHLFGPKKDQELVEEVPYEPFVPLTKEEKVEVERAFSAANRKKVLVSHEQSNIEITGEKFQCLRPGAWLNDEVINLYLELLKERERRAPQKFLKCHFFNTFFYKKLMSGIDGYDFKSVRRWTGQKILGYGLLECDKIFVPIHKEVHWCLAVINKKDEKFQYLDSLKGMDNQVLNVLARYFVDEVKDKTGEDIDVSSWEKEFVEDLPEQKNGYDCGVFMIKYADFYSRDVGLCFKQEHIPYFRLRTAKEILRLKAE